MSAPFLTLRAARNLHLAAQGLLHKPRRQAKPGDLPAIISRMSLLQIDTINIVARSPYLVLFSRLGNYPVSWLDQCLEEGKIFEYWAHEACFVPRRDFGLLRHRMLQPEKMGWKYSADWMQAHSAEVAQLLEHIRRSGPVRAADFSHTSGKGNSGWWEWKPHKKHLEGLFTAGQVMVARRHNFQRIYDLTSRVIPEWDDKQHSIAQSDAEKQMLDNSARSLGIFRLQWLADYYRLPQSALGTIPDEWLRDGTIIPVQVEQVGEMYLHQSLLPLLQSAIDNKLNATHTAVLSPFDPLVWDRRRAEQFFNFSYRLECYTPEHRRRFGYFVLPLLYRGELVGRLDAKMHRQESRLEILNLWLEDGVNPGARLCREVSRALIDFARWQGAGKISCRKLPDVLQQVWEPEWHISPVA